MRQHLRFFLFATLAAFALRLLFIFRFPAITTDSFIYGDIAKNWLQHGIYGLSGDGISPTYIRLPGYPAFLAMVFAIFGMEHYRAVLVVQMFADIGTCFLIADMARRVVSTGAAKVAFVLAALCPFLANYAAAALTETWEIFFTALALDFAIAGVDAFDRGLWRSWLGCGLAIGAAILLRPDGGILLASILLYLACVVIQRIRARGSYFAVLRAAVVLGVVSVAPLVPWTLRNLHTMQKFQPLAPRYANEEDEYVPMGFNHWMKTWIADYVSVEEIYWPVPGATIDAEKLPSRTFDSEKQRDETVQLIADYNDALHVAPELDARFAALASARIQAAPLRYYVWLPAVRIADMWLRPRTELLPSDVRWWEFNDDPWPSTLAVSMGAINLLYCLAAFAGLVRQRYLPHLFLLLTFVVLRSIFLGTLENPEPRYTLECYPIVIVIASALFASTIRPKS
ncbi:MAG TPA: glycosyltransferase family 39 protein [Terriglobales bacterium]|nr:glycosyltransferase family 39 protein [Terriglobales bacterium]